MMEVDAVLAEARRAKAAGATRYCMGAAWREPKERDLDVELVEVENAGHGFKPVQGKSDPPSMTWDETQQLVVRHVLECIQ